MHKRLAGAVLTAMATAMVFAACRDAGVTAPVATTARSASLLGLTSVAPITRSTPLANDVTWSFTVGSGGGTSSNSTVGLTVSVPAGAIDAPTTITVTALKGAEVAYQFEPHGLQFERKLTLTQKLQGTSAGSQLLPLLSGAYFAQDEPILTSGLALVSEVLSGLLNPLAKTFSFQVEHFSGYLVASGRSRNGGTE